MQVIQPDALTRAGDHHRVIETAIDLCVGHERLGFHQVSFGDADERPQPLGFDHDQITIEQAPGGAGLRGGEDHHHLIQVGGDHLRLLLVPRGRADEFITPRFHLGNHAAAFAGIHNAHQVANRHRIKLTDHLDFLHAAVSQ